MVISLAARSYSRRKIARVLGSASYPKPYISSKPSRRNDGVTVGDLVTNGVKSDPAGIY